MVTDGQEGREKKNTGGGGRQNFLDLSLIADLIYKSGYVVFFFLYFFFYVVEQYYCPKERFMVKVWAHLGG